jgi:hypothetical protein
MNGVLLDEIVFLVAVRTSGQGQAHTQLQAEKYTQLDAFMASLAYQIISVKYISTECFL